MAEFNLRSPGIQVREIDKTGRNQLRLGTTTGAYCGAFEWGPANTTVLVSNEAALVNRFGIPTENTALSFMCAANYLYYGNRLVVVRAVNSNTNQFNYNSCARNASESQKDGGSLVAGEITMNVAGNVLVAMSSTLSSGNLTVTISAPGLSGGTQATANILPSQLSNIGPLIGGVSYGGYTVTGINLINPGSGYTSTQGLTITIGGTPNTAPGIAVTPTVKFNARAVVGNTPLLIKNSDDYFENHYLQADSQVYGKFVARYPGDKGNSLKISVCDGLKAWYANTANNELMADGTPFPTGLFTAGYTVNTALIANIPTDMSPTWLYAEYFDNYPLTSTWAESANVVNDEMHIAVIDEKGVFGGAPGTVLETFEGVSKIKNAKDALGASNYYVDVIFNKSQYIYSTKAPTSNTQNWGIDVIGGPNNPQTKCSYANTTDTVFMFNGSSGFTRTLDQISAMNVLKDKVSVDIDLLFTGAPEIVGETTYSANGLDKEVDVRDKAAEVVNFRKDCVAFISPKLAAVRSSDPVNDILDDIARIGDDGQPGVRRSTYTVADSGWKYQYDKYMDKYRWVPLNADIAGLCARTDRTNDPWFSPAGTTRGKIQNAVKLAFNPTQTQRDRLYKSGINPVVTFPAEGTILFGDKTFVTKQSAFDRINVRRLFITIEKIIANAARASLFEFNDEFTRAKFVNLVDPFLRTIKGRRGVYDYLVVCDTTNNTPDVIDANQFIGDIYIKPAKSINFIRLNFVAVRTGVEFSTVVGRI